MIDMLTILVVYLLVHAADYEILPNTKSIQIPLSTSETKPRETVTRADHEGNDLREWRRACECCRAPAPA